jgi:hypothetical protein
VPLVASSGPSLCVAPPAIQHTPVLVCSTTSHPAHARPCVQRHQASSQHHQPFVTSSGLNLTSNEIYHVPHCTSSTCHVSRMPRDPAILSAVHARAHALSCTSPTHHAPRLASPRLASPRLASPRLASPRLASPMAALRLAYAGSMSPRHLGEGRPPGHPPRALALVHTPQRDRMRGKIVRPSKRGTERERRGDVT